MTKQDAGLSTIALCQLVGMFSAELGCTQVRAAFVLRNLFRVLDQRSGRAKDHAKLPTAACWVGDVGCPDVRNDFYRVELTELDAYFVSWATGVKREFVRVQAMLGDGYVESDAAIFFAVDALALLFRNAGATWPLQLQNAKLALPLVPQLVDASKRLSLDQRQVIAARLAFIREIERLTRTHTQQQAILVLVDQANSGALPPRLAEHLEYANDRFGVDRLLSERTLKRWLAAYRRNGEDGLAPGRRMTDKHVPAWGAQFLEHYWSADYTTIKAACEGFRAHYKDDCPSEHQVRSFLRKLKARL